MNYKIYADDVYIYGVGNGDGGSEISAERYNEIITVIRSRPTAPENYGYRLRTDLTWELYELPPAPEIYDELDDAKEALAVLGVE